MVTRSHGILGVCPAPSLCTLQFHQDPKQFTVHPEQSIIQWRLFSLHFIIRILGTLLANTFPFGMATISPIPLAAPLTLRPPVSAFPTSRRLPIVLLRHPGYPDSENILLDLPALDGNGIHHETARIACCILANCRWDGFLSKSRQGPPVPVPEGPQDVLLAGDYYFYVPSDARYAIVPSLRHFRFPDQLPGSWSENENAPISPTTASPSHCSVTRASLPLENAHIIPLKELDWWQQNQMYMYARVGNASLDTCCEENRLALRKDIHHLWDTHRFALVPKHGVWVVHILSPGKTDELQELYHNLTLQPLGGISREYLLARFAIAVFDKLLFSRLRSGLPRKLVWISAPGEPPGEREVPAAECAREFARKGSRTPSRSPSKRPRATDDDDGDEVEEGEDLDSASYHCYCGNRDWESDEGESDRGRPRKRARNRDVDPTEMPSLSRSVLSLPTEASPEPQQQGSRLRTSSATEDAKTERRSQTAVEGKLQLRGERET